jgi:outer membrane protein assembly factor BamB
MNMQLRVRPGIVAAMLVALGYLLLIAWPEAAVVGIPATIVGGLAVFIWWLFFSRARWSVRLGAMALLIGAWLAMRPLLDKSILGGAMGALPVLAFPLFAVALVVWAVTTRSLSNGVRWASIIPAMFVAAGFCTMIRTGGIGGARIFDLHWRWTPTPEDRLLAQPSDEPAPIPAAPSTAAALNEPVAAKANAVAVAVPNIPSAPNRPAEWPGFRGPRRDGVIRNVRIETDWTKSPPVELWRRPIGPGWSSFAVAGDVFYTQEQRGNDEIVASYRVSTGQPMWRHRDAVRFYESNGGAGPRGTPTLHNGRVYSFGGTGLLNALDAQTGAVIWSRNVGADVKMEVPMWGFSSSPLVVDDVVIVAASGTLAAFDIATGKPRWLIPSDSFSYSSPHPATIDGVAQVLMLTRPGVISVSPSDGKLLWDHTWEGGAIVQPAVTDDGSILINTIAVSGGQGIRRLAVAMKSGKWTVDERWTSNGLKPYFNDFVVHNGHAFGFDGSILSCIDLADGKRKWKGGRYGSGQLILLADQSLLLVLSEEGELALVNATPDEFKELARFKAIEGKTWNHPVVVGDVLLVRNGEEMAAFKLAPASR